MRHKEDLNQLVRKRDKLTLDFLSQNPNGTIQEFTSWNNSLKNFFTGESLFVPQRITKEDLIQILKITKSIEMICSQVLNFLLRLEKHEKELIFREIKNHFEEVELLFRVRENFLKEKSVSKKVMAQGFSPYVSLYFLKTKCEEQVKDIICSFLSLSKEERKRKRKKIVDVLLRFYEQEFLFVKMKEIHFYLLISPLS